MAKTPGFPAFPRPGLGTIAAAVSGNAEYITGLDIPGLEIDPRNNFIKGTFIYAQRIDRLGMAFTSFKEPLLTSLNQVIVPSIRKNFEEQGRPKWKKLMKQTVYSRLRQGFPRGPILQRTRRLYKAATRKNIWYVEDNILKMRTTYFDQLVPYGRFHQLGARLGDFVEHQLSTKITSVGGGPTGHLWDKPERYRTHPFVHITRTHIFDPKGYALPRRPYIDLQLDEEGEIYGIFMAFMIEKVNKYWGHGSMGL